MIAETWLNVKYQVRLPSPGRVPGPLSYYRSRERLLNEIGKTIMPKMKCLIKILKREIATEINCR
jgi:hypothetical protein